MQLSYDDYADSAARSEFVMASGPAKTMWFAVDFLIVAFQGPMLRMVFLTNGPILLPYWVLVTGVTG